MKLKLAIAVLALLLVCGGIGYRNYVKSLKLSQCQGEIVNSLEVMYGPIPEQLRDQVLGSVTDYCNKQYQKGNL